MDERQPDGHIALSEARALCDRIETQLNGAGLQRGKLAEVEVAAEHLTEQLEHLVNRYTVEAGGTHSVLRARQAVDTMRKILRWIERYGTFAPEVEIQQRLSDAGREATLALTMLERLTG